MGCNTVCNCSKASSLSDPYEVQIKDKKVVEQIISYHQTPAKTQRLDII
jgi:hypothetical protein